MVARKIITKTLQRYWRMSRGLRLEVRGVVRAAGGHVLLTRDREESLWRLPGTAVAKHEAAETALGRGLADSCNLVVLGPARLLAIEAEERPGGIVHVAYYEVTSWRLGGKAQGGEENGNLELFEARTLPAGLHADDRGAISMTIRSRKRGEMC